MRGSIVDASVMADHTDDQAQHGLMEITDHENAMEFIAVHMA